MKMPKKVLALLTALVLGSGTALLIVVSCSGGGQSTRQREEDALIERSRAGMALAWAAASEVEREQICMGLDLYGWEWTRENFMSRVPPEERDRTDWDVAVAYTAERCVER